LGRAITSLSFSRDGQHLLSGAEDGTLSWWDVAAEKKLASFKAPAGVRDVACLGADEAWVTTSADKRLQHWSLARRALLRAFGAHSQWPRVALSGDERVAVSVGRDSSILSVWDVATRKKRGDLRGHQFGLDAWKPSPDGKSLLSVGWYDGTLRAWDLAQLKPRWVKKDWHLGRVAWSPDGKRLVACASSRVVVCEAARGAKVVWEVRAPAGEVAWPSPDCVAALSRAALTLFSAKDGAVRSTEKVSGEGSALAASTNGTLAIGTKKGGLTFRTA
jgi:WD40 repeat protein